MSSSDITYNAAGVSGLASDVGTAAGQLAEIHADIAQRTQALAEFFAGLGASGFFDAQGQALHGLEGLIGTVARHGSTVTNVHENAVLTDQMIAHGFGGGIVT